MYRVLKKDLKFKSTIPVLCQFLNEDDFDRRLQFGRRWIGRRGPVDWPTRSPDLIPPDFWLLGFLKERFYSRRPQNVSKLRAFITQEINAIPQAVIQNVTESVPARYATLIEKEGKQ